MSLAGYGNRYLMHKEFLKLCKELEVNSFSSSMDERWLELLEQNEILFPVCRIKYPLSYLKIINDVKYDPSNIYYGKHTFYLPDKYGTIENLKKNIRQFWLSKSLYHPLDKLNNKNIKYVYNPKKQKFQKWKNYEKLVGKYQEIEHYESIAEHYYSYWQAYHFYEVTKACTLDYVINVFNEETRTKLWHLRIPLKEIFSRTLPLKYDRIKEDFWDQSRNFDLLSFYVQTIKKFEFLVSRSKIYPRNTLGYLDEKSTEKYFQRLTTITKEIVKKYNFNSIEGYNFLRFLCERYEEYRDKKKDKLVEFIKNDIYYLTLMMQNGFKLEFETINKNLGRVIRDFGNTLDIIFPPMFAEEKANVQSTLNSSLSSNFNFHKYENVSKDEIKDFLNFIDSNHLQLFYYSLGQINIKQFSDQSIYLHIFYLSLLFENILKIIARASNKTELTITFNKHIKMKQTIDKYFDQEGWRHELSSNWLLTEVVPSFDIRERIFAEIANGNFHKIEEWNNIIKMFLVSVFARNLSTHEQSKLLRIDRETYLILVNNIVTAIWFSWAYAIKNNYVSVNPSKK